MTNYGFHENKPFIVLKVDEQRRHDLVHMCWFPYIALQIVGDRLVHDALQATQASDTQSTGQLTSNSWTSRDTLILTVSYTIRLIMAALRSRCGHYIFILWFLLSFFFFSSPNLSGRRLDVYRTCTYGVALVQI